MSAALTILILAVIAFSVFLIAYGASVMLRFVGWVIAGTVNFLRHESMMRPKERYYRMM